MTFEQGALIVIATLGGVVTLLFKLMMEGLKDRLAKAEKELAAIENRFDTLQGLYQDAESALAQKTAELQAAKEKWTELRNVLEGCSVDYCPMRPRLQSPKPT
jgi:chromosome segregation ATPase